MVDMDVSEAEVAAVAALAEGHNQPGRKRYKFEGHKSRLYLYFFAASTNLSTYICGRIQFP